MEDIKNYVVIRCTDSLFSDYYQIIEYLMLNDRIIYYIRYRRHTEGILLSGYKFYIDDVYYNNNNINDHDTFIDSCLYRSNCISECIDFINMSISQEKYNI